MDCLKIYRTAGDGGAGSGQGSAGGADAGAASAAGSSGAAGEAGAGVGECGEVQKKEMTQDDLNALVSGSRKEGAEKIAKQHGFVTADGKPDVKALDAFIADAKKRIEDDKTAEEKDKEQREKDRKDREAAEARALTAETKAAALEAGVDPKKINRAIKLIATYEGDTPADKVAALLAEFPDFKTNGKPLPDGGIGAGIKNQHLSDKEKAAAELDSVFGKKKP